MQAVKALWTPTSRLYGFADEGKPRQFRQELSIGWQNYHNGQTWQAIDSGFSEPDGGGFHAQFTRIPRLVRLGNDGRKRIYPVPGNDQVWIQLYKPDELTLGQPTSKIGGIWTWDRNAYTFQLIVEGSRVKFKLTLKQAVGTNTLHIPFATQGIQRQGRTLLHNGEVVAELKRPTVKHAGMSDIDEPIPINITFGAGEIVLQLNTLGMQYPIVIDPPVDLQVGASADDARELDDDTGFSAVAVTNPIYRDFNPDDRWSSGYRFVDASLTQGDTITSCTFSPYVDPDLNGRDDINADIHFELVAAPANYVDTADLINRAHTIAFVNWTEAAMGQGFKPSPDLTTGLQEVVDAFTPTALNVLARPTTGAAVRCDTSTYDRDSAEAAKLAFTFTGGGAAQSSLAAELLGAGVL